MPLAGCRARGRSAGWDQFLAGTKNIWWLSLCVDCLPVLGHVTLFWPRFARFFGRLFPSYRSPILCLSTGPFSSVTEIPSSCSPAHLLQEATMLYCVVDLCAVEAAASPIASFSCIVVLRSSPRIVPCFGSSVKDIARGRFQMIGKRLDNVACVESATHIKILMAFYGCAIPPLNWPEFDSREFRRGTISSVASVS